MNRSAHLRSDDAWLAAAWAHPSSKVLVIDNARALTAGDRLVWTPAGDAPDGERLFLGTPDDGESGAAYFAVMGALPASPPEGTRAASLREVGSVLPAAEAGLMAHASALEQWHLRHPRCPRCGAPTTARLGGHVRVCVDDGSEHYPRTDPAVIMLVTDDADRALLGHQPSWPQGRMSTLAGYVEAGETLEEAVVREVAEEVGVVVDGVRYVESQPWPFPSSLMLAFTAHATSSDLAPDGVEITDARWFTRDEMTACAGDGSLRLPMRASVAFRLINRWHGGDLG
ncbi:MAG TPA: NAD(+) diphosphatase [Acidothermaceae bacterium]